MVCQPFFQIFNDLLMIQIIVGLVITFGIHQELLVRIGYFFKEILTPSDRIDRVAAPVNHENRHLQILWAAFDPLDRLL